MVGIHESNVSWVYWDEYVQYLINKNKTIQRIRDNLKRQRAKRKRNNENRLR